MSIRNTNSSKSEIDLAKSRNGSDFDRADGRNHYVVKILWKRFLQKSQKTLPLARQRLDLSAIMPFLRRLLPYFAVVMLYLLLTCQH